LVGGVEFTPGYVAFLVYIAVVTTLVVPIADVAMAVAVFTMLIPQPGGYRFPAPMRWMTALLIWLTLGVALSPYAAVVSDQVYGFLKLAVIAFVAVNVIRTRGQITFFIIFSLACYAFFPARAGIFAHFVYGGSGYGGRTAWKGIFGNPNDLAAMTLLPLSTCLGILFAGRNALLRLVSLAGVGVLGLVILLTQSRGAMVALSVFVIAALVTTRGRQRRQRAGALLLGGLAGAALTPASTWERFAGLANATQIDNLQAVDGSAEQRFEIWKVARRITMEHPITGIGWGAYGIEHGIVAQRSEFKRTAGGQRDTHSTYLSMSAEAGLVGLMLFVGILGSTVLYAERVRRRVRQVLPADATQLLYLELGLLAYCIAAVWGSYAKLPPTYVHVMLIWAFAEMTRRTAESSGLRLR
jgi:O-antigen ligase